MPRGPRASPSNGGPTGGAPSTSVGWAQRRASASVTPPASSTRDTLGTRLRMIPSSRCSLPTARAPIARASSRASVTAARASLVTTRRPCSARSSGSDTPARSRYRRCAAWREMPSARATSVNDCPRIERPRHLEALERVELLAQRRHRPQRRARLAGAQGVLDELPQPFR